MSRMSWTRWRHSRGDTRTDVCGGESGVDGLFAAQCPRPLRDAQALVRVLLVSGATAAAGVPSSKRCTVDRNGLIEMGLAM